MQSSKKIARRDKKAFLSEKFTEIEESNRMGKARDGKDLTEAKEFKKEVARIHRT